MDDTPKYRHQAVAVACKIDPKQGLCVKLRRRTRAPYEGQWELPSGAVDVDETIDESVLRYLGLGERDIKHFEQVETRSAVGRDPFDRTIATSYLILCGAECGGGGWRPIAELGELAFDHAEVLAVAHERLCAKLSYTNISFALAPEEFTIAQLRGVYETVLGYAVDASNLQRVLMRREQLEETGNHLQPPGGGRPARCYRFREQALVVTDPFVAFRP